MAQDDPVEILCDLIQTAKDSEYGFRSSADVLRDREFRQVFLRCADEWRQSASEMQALVRQLGGASEKRGLAVWVVHPGWAAVKARQARSSDKTILEVTSFGEDMAAQIYSAALGRELPSMARAVVKRQFESVKRNCARVCALRDQARAMDTWPSQAAA